MEACRAWRGANVACVRARVSDRGLSGRLDHARRGGEPGDASRAEGRHVARRRRRSWRVIDPLLSLCIVGPKRQFAAGDELVCEYQIDAVEPADIQAVEFSVLWHTEGKGESDLGVHFFERRLPSDADNGDLRPMRRLRTRLPNSPLSYRGAILNIHWC